MLGKGKFKIRGAVKPREGRRELKRTDSTMTLGTEGCRSVRTVQSTNFGTTAVMAAICHEGGGGTRK